MVEIERGAAIRTKEATIKAFVSETSQSGAHRLFVALCDIQIMHY